MVLLQHPEDFTNLSRLFVYYNSRALDGATDADQGAYLRDAIKAVRAWGICSEDLWPYDVNTFTVKPSAASYQDALTRSIDNYRRLDSIDGVIEAVGSNVPVIFGIKIFSEFDRLTKINPVVSKPSSISLDQGGHAMCLVGYDRPSKLLLAKNSYGITWGDAGYCWIPFDYFEEYSYDVWVFDIINHLPIPKLA